MSTNFRVTVEFALDKGLITIENGYCRYYELEKVSNCLNAENSHYSMEFLTIYPDPYRLLSRLIMGFHKCRQLAIYQQFHYTIFRAHAHASLCD